MDEKIIKEANKQFIKTCQKLKALGYAKQTKEEKAETHDAVIADLERIWKILLKERLVIKRR